MIILTGPNDHPDSNEHHGGEEGRLGRVQGQAGDHSQGANIFLGLILPPNILLPNILPPNILLIIGLLLLPNISPNI